MSNQIQEKGFTTLKAWQEAHKLVLQIYSITIKFPKEEIFGLVSQLRRAAVSVSSNLAEGSSRISSKEKTNFYRISIGSLIEVENQLLIARDIGYISRPDFEKIRVQVIFVRKLCYGLTKSLVSLTHNT